jgi:hypothetical protein
MGKKKAYMGESERAHDVVQGRWLELPENYGKYRELFTLPYGDPKRVLLNAVNEDPVGQCMPV